jgi:Spy/CpxP family protein refolding chaperone
MKRMKKWISASLAAMTVTGLLAVVDGPAIARQAEDVPVALRGSPWDGGGPRLERLAQQLSLSDAQKASIRDVIKQSRQAAQAERGASPPNLAALLIPTDANHAAAVAAARQRAADAVQRMVDTEARIYVLLTPAQQAQLANLIASRAGRAPRR